MSAESSARRERPAARWLLLDAAGRVLLFRFAFDHGPRAGESFWATPGGALEPGEDFAQAARRELREEVGLTVDDVGPQVAQQRVAFALPDGTPVHADERYFALRMAGTAVDRRGWSALEREVMREHRWWTAEALAATADTVWPDDLAALLARLPVDR